jgi:hypothetical protein
MDYFADGKYLVCIGARRVHGSARDSEAVSPKRSPLHTININ